MERLFSDKDIASCDEAQRISGSVIAVAKFKIMPIIWRSQFIRRKNCALKQHLIRLPDLIFGAMEGSQSTCGVYHLY